MATHVVQALRKENPCHDASYWPTQHQEYSMVRLLVVPAIQELFQTIFPVSLSYGSWNKNWLKTNKKSFGTVG